MHFTVKLKQTNRICKSFWIALFAKDNCFKEFAFLIHFQIHFERHRFEILIFRITSNTQTIRTIFAFSPYHQQQIFADRSFLNGQQADREKLTLKSDLLHCKPLFVIGPLTYSLTYPLIYPAVGSPDDQIERSPMAHWIANILDFKLLIYFFG